ncbi:hypothetical protein HC761_00235 [bacterium]|nr:hypothetical protein [bacterium]
MVLALSLSACLRTKVIEVEVTRVMPPPSVFTDQIPMPAPCIKILDAAQAATQAPAAIAAPAPLQVTNKDFEQCASALVAALRLANQHRQQLRDIK